MKIPRGLALSKTGITQGAMVRSDEDAAGPAAFQSRSDWHNLPVVSVTWHDAQRFVVALNRRARTARYRLQTEAEWEYAARAGSDDNRPFPVAELAAHAWTLGNSGDVPHPVGVLPANAWGLHDMLGNAWEWVGGSLPARLLRIQSISRSARAGRWRTPRAARRFYHCAPHFVRVNTVRPTRQIRVIP